MTPILIFIIILLAAAVGALVVFARREAGKHGTPVPQRSWVRSIARAKEEFVGICKSAVETASQKEARKQKIIALLRGNKIPPLSGTPFTKGEWGNAEIRKELGVSSRTAVRYLDELEKEGKVEQVGKVGHAVTYRVKTSSARRAA